ncbi:MAG: hypothetical protein RL075_1543 [Pseudomonadota bacterium]|jgi:hypothetical protein
MVFITRCWKNAPLEAGAKRSRLRGLLLMALMLVALCAALPAARAAGAATAQLTQLRTQSADDGIYLSANVDFELPNVVEDALLKGIPLFFVLEVEILRDRWYWTDQRVAAASRTIRLAYQPLTRRWRVNIGSGIIGSASSLRATFNQNYDTLADALSAVQRVARWKVAEPSDIRPGADHSLVFSFKLDLSQLPRPFQIGVAGQRDWTIAIESTQKMTLQAARPAEQVKDSPSSEGLK